MFNTNEIAAILAGLRLLQRAIESESVPKEIAEIHEDCDYYLGAYCIDGLCQKINCETPTVLIEIEGGRLCSVLSTHENIGVELRDFDNIKEGDDDPLAKHHDLKTGETDYDKAGYPFVIW